MKEIKIGDKFTHLTVVALNNQHWRGSTWVCKCDCGKEVILGSCHLLGSKNRRPNKSCGCTEHAHNGLVVENLRLYNIWKGMIKRCYSPKATEYERYGGKGVRVSSVFHNYEFFYRWALQNGYSNDLTIDRIDSTKDYGPENCRWVNYYVQNQNKGVSKRSSTGILGVYRHNDSFYRAGIRRDNVTVNLGLFRTTEAATRARKEAEEHYKIFGTLINYRQNRSS